MEISTYERRKIYDGVLRLIHAWNGLSILFLVVTVWFSAAVEHGAGEKTLWQIHIYLGYALVLGLAARLAWGMAGPRHARFSDMWHPRAWVEAITRFRLVSPPRFGHDALASGVYLALYVLLIVMAGSGLALAAIEHSVGPLTPWLGDSAWLKEAFEEPHEIIYNVVLAFVVVHIGALIWHEHKEKRPIAQAMVSGYQYLAVKQKGESNEK